MNVNEVLANRALELLGRAARRPTTGSRRSTTSTCTSRTNDTFPTALRLAAIRLLHELEEQVVAPAGGLPGQGEGVRPRRQGRPHRSSRTRCSPRWAARWAPTPRPSTATAGASTSARSGCAWSTSAAPPSAPGLAAPRAVHLPRGRHAARAHRHRLRARREPGRGHPERRRLRRGLGHPQGLRRLAAQDLRRPAPARPAAPRPAWARSACRARQAGSSIMPGKVNPVIPEAVSQAAMLVMGYDAAIAMACAAGQPGAEPVPAAGRRLPAREPRPAGRAACEILRRALRRGHRGRRGALPRARASLDSAAATALVPALGYDARLRRGRARPRAQGATHPRGRRSPRACSPPSSSTSCSRAEAVCRLGHARSRDAGAERMTP